MRALRKLHSTLRVPSLRLCRGAAVRIYYRRKEEVMTESVASITVHADPLKPVVRAVIGGAGSSAREAELVAEQLVEANLTGHDSHGVGMLPRYVEVFLAGDLKINQHVAAVTDAGPLLTLDGNAGFGQVMGFEAIERGI